MQLREKLEEFDRELFGTFRSIGRNEWHFRPFMLAQKVNLPEEYAYQRLLEHANRGRIDVSAHDANIGKQRNWRDWNPPTTIFHAHPNGGYIDAVLLLAGAEYAELLLKRPIGFVVA